VDIIAGKGEKRYQHVHRELAKTSALPETVVMATYNAGLQNGAKEVIESVIILAMGLFRSAPFNRERQLQLSNGDVPNDVKLPNRARGCSRELPVFSPPTTIQDAIICYHDGCDAQCPAQTA